jgi:hypothetical protein
MARKRPLFSFEARSRSKSVITIAFSLPPEFRRGRLPGGEASDALAVFMIRPASCALNRRCNKTENKKQKTRFGLRAETGRMTSALAEFIKRPQAESQIGAEEIVDEALATVKKI